MFPSHDRWGGHIFKSRDREVEDWVFTKLPKKHWIYRKKNAKIFMDGKHYSYPIELNLREFGAKKWLYFISVLLGKFVVVKDYATYIKHNFGYRLFKKYFKPYQEKIWQTPIEEIGLGWLENVPKIKLRDIWKGMFNPVEEKTMLHAYHYMPKNGMQDLIKKIKVKDLRLNTNVKRVAKMTRGYMATGS